MGTEALRFLRMFFAGWVHRGQLEAIDYLKEESRVLREQLGARRLRFTDDQRRRLGGQGAAVGPAASGGARRPRDRGNPFALVPRVHRQEVRRLGSPRGRSTSQRCRPATARSAVRLREPELGLHADSRCLRNLGHELGSNTIKRILLGHGVQPAPSRRKRMPWKTFLKAHAGSLCAVDFFSVEVLTLTGLVRTFVLFVIDVETRRVQICGVVRQPHGDWMKQVARNLTDGVDGLLAGKRFLIHDRDPLFTQEFWDILRAARHPMPEAAGTQP